jgi:hypothetical protein
MWAAGEELNLLPLFVRLQARCIVTILAELSQRTVETLDKRFAVELGVANLHCRSFTQLL